MALVSSTTALADTRSRALPSSPRRTRERLASAERRRGGQPERLESADLNRDGRPDLVVSDGASALRILLWTGAVTFTAAPDVTLPAPSNGVALADVDRDGRIDVIAACPSVGQLIIARGQGDGTFAPGVALSCSPQPLSPVVVELDGDGWPDLVARDGGANTAHVLRGPLLGAFSRSALLLPRGHGRNPAVVADFDRDGAPDLVAVGSATFRYRRR